MHLQFIKEEEIQPNELAFFGGRGTERKPH